MFKLLIKSLTCIMASTSIMVVHSCIFNFFITSSPTATAAATTTITTTTTATYSHSQMGSSQCDTLPTKLDAPTRNLKNIKNKCVNQTAKICDTIPHPHVALLNTVFGNN